MQRHAHFSLCRRYRYALWRSWASNLARVLFIGLNLSIGDERCDHPTLLRCLGYALSWCYGGLYIANLFAAVSTDSRGLKARVDPVGSNNDQWLQLLYDKYPRILAIWGNCGGYLDRLTQVTRMLPRLDCLGRTKSGQPLHPLYQPAELIPQSYYVIDAPVR